MTEIEKKKKPCENQAQSGIPVLLWPKDLSRELFNVLLGRVNNVELKANSTKLTMLTTEC